MDGVFGFAGLALTALAWCRQFFLSTVRGKSVIDSGFWLMAFAAIALLDVHALLVGDGVFMVYYLGGTAVIAYNLFLRLREESADSIAESNEVFHVWDEQLAVGNLKGFYGAVCGHQDDLISAQLRGKILDVGAGLGTQTKHFREKGFDVVAVDLEDRSIDAAKRLNGIEVLKGDVYCLPFPDKSFGTVVAKDLLAHLDFQRALKELSRVSGRLVFFESNETPALRFCRWLVGHREYNSRPVGYYVKILKEAGFRIEHLSFHNSLDFPLSGGLVSKQFIPGWRSLYGPLMGLSSLLDFLLGRNTAFKFLMVAEKHHRKTLNA